MTTFTELAQRLTGRNHMSRKLANNTYAQRSGPNIAIRFHETDILTFRPDGKVVLNAGGWFQPVTLARMNEFLPAPFRMSQSGGHWHVRAHDVHAYYRDGMVIDTAKPYKMAGVSEADIAKENKANRIIDARIKVFLTNDVTPENVVKALNNMGGDCFYCLFAVKTMTPDGTRVPGTSLGDAQHSHSHLAEHMKEHYVVGSMLRNAVISGRYTDCQTVLTMIYRYAQQGDVTMIHRLLTKFLRQRLRVGSTVTKSKQTPEKAGRW